MTNVENIGVGWTSRRGLVRLKAHKPRKFRSPRMTWIVSSYKYYNYIIISRAKQSETMRPWLVQACVAPLGLCLSSLCYPGLMRLGYSVSPLRGWIDSTPAAHGFL
jgi:hypothetical protein